MSRAWRLLIGMVGLAGSPALAHGQLLAGRVLGRALDASGAPAVGVRIAWADAGAAVVSRADGWFALGYLPPGTRRLVATYPDGTVGTAEVAVYEDEDTWVTVRADRQRGTVALLVEPGPRRAGSTVHAIGGDALHALPVDAVGQVLLLVPGLAEPEQDGRPALRGGGPRESAVWLDGVPLRTAGGRAFGLGVAPMGLDGLTVRTGPLPAPMGDAQSGVISLVSRTGGTRWRGELTYETDDLFGRGTSIGRNQVEGAAGGSLPGGLSIFGSASVEGRATQAYGPGGGDAAAFLPGITDTVVTETLFDGSTRSIALPTFHRYSGTCDAAENAGEPCHGRSLPYDWSTALSLSGTLSWRYRNRSSLGLTLVRHVAQGRFWPAGVTFNPAAYAGRRSAGTTWILSWTQVLGGTDRAPTVQLAASRQTARTTSGPLDPTWEASHRDPALGIALSPMEFLVDFDRFSADTGVGALTRLATNAAWDRLVENVVTNTGTRVPFRDRNDLRFAQPYRMNPWAAALGLPTEGLDDGTGTTIALAGEAHWIGRAVVTVPLAGPHRVRAGAEATRSRVTAFSGSLIDQTGLTVYAEDPVQAGAFAELRVVAGGLTVDGGLRWDTFDPRAAFPVVPGRLFTHPSFDPTDPYDPSDSVFAAAPSRSAVSPRVRLGYVGPGPLAFRLGYAAHARHPDYATMFSGKNRDLAFTSVLSALGGPLDWERSRQVEFGANASLGGSVMVDAAVFRVWKVSDVALELVTVLDPVAGFEQVRLVPVNADTGAVTGVELSLTGRPARWLDARIGYSLADARASLQAMTNRQHTVAGWLGARWPEGAAAGSWAARVFAGGEAWLRLRVSSGLPYGPLPNVGAGIVAPPGGAGAPPAARLDLPAVKELDLRLARAFATAGVRWSVFADVRNLFNWRNTYRLFAETDDVENAEHRRLVVEPELARLEGEAGTRWVQVMKDGQPVFAADLTGDCGAWGGGPVNCVLLRRAEARWGNGDGFYDVDEARTGFDAMYDLFSGPRGFLGPARQARVGVEIRL